MTSFAWATIGTPSGVGNAGLWGSAGVVSTAMADGQRGRIVDLADLVKAAKELEPLSASALRLLELSSRPNIEIGDVIGVVEIDPALTATVLRLANSSMSSPLREIGTAHDAVVRLGVDLVISSALSAGPGRQLRAASPVPSPPNDPAEADLWRHSIAAALAANLLRRRAKVEITPDVIAAALLHDIGKIVLSQYLTHEQHDSIADHQTANNVSRIEAEAESLALHHGGLGGVIAEHWKLPQSIVRSIAEHHSPSADAPTVVWATYLAAVVAYRITNNAPTAFADDPNLGKAFDKLQLTPSALADIVERVTNDLDDVVRTIA